MSHNAVTPPEEDDDFEYEVEPADADVTANQQRLAREELARAQSAIDVDAIYREMHRSDDFDAAFESFRARFSVKTLLIATTVVAVLLGIGGSGLLTGSTFAGFICVSLLGLGSAHAWLNYQENRRREELIARREAELRRARRSGGSALDDMDDEEEETPAARMPAAPVSPMEMLAGFLRFSTMEMLGAVTVAAGMLALLTLVGSPAQAAAAMGALAITGFALQAADIDIPRPLLLAWWIALLGYCVFSLVSLAVA